MQEMISKQIAKIDSLDSASLAEYRESLIKYSVPGETRSTLLKACEDKLERLDRSNALVEETDFSDMGGNS